MFKRAGLLVLLTLTGVFTNGAHATGITPQNPPGWGGPGSGSECSYAPVRGGQCWTTEDVIDKRIDHHAQTGLLRMFTRGGDRAAEASAILCAVKTSALEGVHLPDQQAPALRARDAGSGWWNILPKGQNSICYQQPPGRAPMIVFGKPVKDNPDLTANALADAWRQCGLQAAAPRCYSATISKPAAAGAAASATIVVKPTRGGIPYQGMVDVAAHNLAESKIHEKYAGRGVVRLPVNPGTYWVFAAQHAPSPGVFCVAGPVYEITVGDGQTAEIYPEVPPCDDSGRQHAEPPVPESGGF